MFLSPKGWMVVFNVKKIWEIQICKSYKSKSRTSLLKITLKSGTVKISAEFGPKMYFCKSAKRPQNWYYYTLLSIPTWFQSE